jgi:hypothetical protein
MTPGDRLKELASLYESKNKEYGDNYKRFGNVLFAMFPECVVLDTPEKLNRMALFVQILHKVCRYAQNFDEGHGDSLDDLAVYAVLLKVFDDEMFDLRHRNNRADS